MKHLGDITNISGYEVPIVDVIIGGSPCQDLSIAGKRDGLGGQRSGLFMEQIRIIKEMRECDKANGRTGIYVRPRYAVWENVPGAFSSNGGKDFKAVLESFIRIAELEAPEIPLFGNAGGGRWLLADAYYGDGWSIAYRVFDAQFWGVPQRRRRIALVADFGGWSAPEILFERKSLYGNINESKAEREDITATIGASIGTAIGTNTKGTCIPINTMLATRSNALGERTGLGIGEDGEPQFTLSTNHEHDVFCLQGNTVDRNAKQNGNGIIENISYTLNSTDRHAVLCLNDQGGNIMSVTENVSGTLRAQEHGHNPCVLSVQQNASGEVRMHDIVGAISTNQNASGRNTPLVFENHPNDSRVKLCEDGVVQTLSGRMGTGGGNTPLVMATGQANAEVCNAIKDKCGTLQATDCKDPPAVYRQTENSFVRRLTPLECERLQGFPDNWTNIGEWVDTKGKVHKESSDSARYKSLGNSISIPNWKYVLKRISAQYERDATMASLFDGIGGFPYIWEQLNGKGSCIWCSEIEEFPIAVTKYHFGDE